jgi:hypothetical protein
MAVAPEMPKALQACESCGHDPERIQRLHYLAGCPDDHGVFEYFDINWLEQRFAHVWPDQTYSALTVEHGQADDDVVLAWLDAVHSGQSARHPRDQAAEITFERMIRDVTHHENGDVTVTYRLPLLEGGGLT